MILSFSTLMIRGLEKNEISTQSVKKNFSAKWNFDFWFIENLYLLQAIDTNALRTGITFF